MRTQTYLRAQPQQQMLQLPTILAIAQPPGAQKCAADLNLLIRALVMVLKAVNLDPTFLDNRQILPM